MRRCFKAILDPHPSETETSYLWDYFESTCAYCGTLLDRSARSGHFDHVVSSSAGGTNSIHNHVLSCARCNGDEKREREWREFLLSKVADADVAKQRLTRIDEWLSRSPTAEINEQRRMKAEAIVKRALSSFDEAVKQLRAMRSTLKQNGGRV